MNLEDKNHLNNKNNSNNNNKNLNKENQFLLNLKYKIMKAKVLNIERKKLQIQLPQHKIYQPYQKMTV